VRQSCDGDASSGGSTTEQEEEEVEVLLPNSILANPARFQALIKFCRSVQEFSQQVRVLLNRFGQIYIFFFWSIEWIEFSSVLLSALEPKFLITDPDPQN